MKMMIIATSLTMTASVKLSMTQKLPSTIENSNTELTKKQRDTK